MIGTPWDTAPVDYERRPGDLWPPRHLEVRDRDVKSIIAGIVCGLLFVMTIWVLS